MKRPTSSMGVAAIANMALSGFWVIFLAALLLFPSLSVAKPNPHWKDLTLFVLAWSYIGVTPSAALVTLVIQRRKGREALITYVIVALWIAFMLWASTARLKL